MATEEDALVFRRDWWTSERMERYDGKWIAFQNNEVVASNPSLSELSSRFLGAIAEGRGPIFAFVSLGIRA
jgi:ribosomal protein L14